jgi:hypothetical protein
LPDPKLAALSNEELAALDAISKKLALPAPDGPQNQIESKPAIEAEVNEEALIVEIEADPRGQAFSGWIRPPFP